MRETTQDTVEQRIERIRQYANGDVRRAMERQERRAPFVDRVCGSTIVSLMLIGIYVAWVCQ